MKIIETKTEIKEFKSIQLNDLHIGEKVYDLKITQWFSAGGIQLCFVNPKNQIVEFEINISNELSLGRHVYRPKHDHDDTEHAYMTDENKIYWTDNFPSDPTKRLMIPFGSKVDF